MKTILVSGASGILGYGILKSLKRSYNLYKLIGTSIYDDSIAPVFCDIFEKAVRTDSDGYMDWLMGVIEKHKVDMIIPGIECDMYEWNKHRNVLNRITFPLLNNKNLIDICSDKWKFYQKLINENEQYAILTDIRCLHNPFVKLPVLLKPRHGFGSQGIIKIKTLEEYDNHKWDIKYDGLMVQPIIKGDEYTVSAFYDCESNLIDYIAFKRKLSKLGWTEVAEVSDIDCNEMLLDLAETFKPLGPTNFQFRVNNGIKLLEINPRISASTSIRAILGYNEAVMSVEYFLNGIMPKKSLKPINKRAIRYTEDYIF